MVSGGLVHSVSTNKRSWTVFSKRPIAISVRRRRHIKAVCKSEYTKVRSSSQLRSSKTHWVGHIQTSDVLSAGTSNDNARCYQRIGKQQIWIPAEINGKELMCQWDTGSACSVAGLEGYQMLDSLGCFRTDTPLLTYGGRPLSVKGQCVVNVRVGDTRKKQLKLVGVNMFGLRWNDGFGFAARGMSQPGLWSRSPTFYSRPHRPARKLDHLSVEQQGKTDVLCSYTQPCTHKRNLLITRLKSHSKLLRFLMFSRQNYDFVLNLKFLFSWNLELNRHFVADTRPTCW